MAEDAVDNAVFVTKQEKRECLTKDLALGNASGRMEVIGQLITKDPTLKELIHSRYPYLKAEIVYAVRYEMALTVEDILARRTRLLFLDATAALEASPLVAAVMAHELAKGEVWQKEQLNLFKELAKQYILS
jgi:glycerol-3-phosphate dehydrogenase